MQISWWQLPVLGLFLAIAFIINALISMTILGGSFFMDQGRTLSHVKWMLGGILSGSLLPLSAYPTGLEKLARMLPFQYSFAVPVEYALGQVTTANTINAIFLAVFWIGALYALMRIIWFYGLKRFTAVGN